LILAPILAVLGRQLLDLIPSILEKSLEMFFSSAEDFQTGNVECR
jgi:hypothetical protein